MKTVCVFADYIGAAALSFHIKHAKMIQQYVDAFIQSSK